jgi:hypothetical protein
LPSRCFSVATLLRFYFLQQLAGAGNLIRK